MKIFQLLRFIDTVWFFFLMFGVTLVLNLVMGTNFGDFLATGYFLINGMLCLRNYFTYRSLVCGFTAPGFFLATLFMLFRILHVFDHGFGIPYIFVAISALVGHLLEQKTRGIQGRKR